MIFDNENWSKIEVPDDGFASTTQNWPGHFGPDRSKILIENRCSQTNAPGRKQVVF
jgi:hypothetical protein